MKKNEWIKIIMNLNKIKLNTKKLVRLFLKATDSKTIQEGRKKYEEINKFLTGRK